MHSDIGTFSTFGNNTNKYHAFVFVGKVVDMQPTPCITNKIKEDMNPQKPPPKVPRYEGAGERGTVPEEIMAIILPALQIGGLAGASGTIFGGFAGVVRSNTPILFALASGIQWFTLGTTFFASRNLILHSWKQDTITPNDEVKASAIAGSIGGGFSGLLRGPRNILPGAIMFALFGATGQYIYNTKNAQHSQVPLDPQDGKTEKGKWLNSKWSPVKVLSDKEYSDMLQEKLLRLNAQIALIDGDIDALRAQEKEEARVRAGDEMKVKK